MDYISTNDKINKCLKTHEGKDHQQVAAEMLLQLRGLVVHTMGACLVSSMYIIDHNFL